MHQRQGTRTPSSAERLQSPAQLTHLQDSHRKVTQMQRRLDRKKRPTRNGKLPRKVTGDIRPERNAASPQGNKRTTQRVPNVARSSKEM
ncbi:hypothetical protein AVEN_220299-1 [Araneus ventricosus]|uniref:Uncharacterized protein n=1 Tax=Araneus ventricosus TaxID=182803 RepID=A0A4Y2NNX3_ARAVE|nr:hypothetical protein AVEN_187248-1 [Araneus ventricosus]GBN40632.1 hypothetical protein AVEN_220299-1 [Araneus ventricosus]